MALQEERWFFRRRGGSLGEEVVLYAERWLFRRSGGSLRGEVALQEERWLFRRRGGSLGGEVDLWEERWLGGSGTDRHAAALGAQPDPPPPTANAVNPKVVCHLNGTVL